jgi:hypothetical protein
MKQIFYDCGHTVIAIPCESVIMQQNEGKIKKIKSDCIEIEIHYDKNPDITFALTKQSALSLASQITEIFKSN